jgi:predicted nucleotidyltransferase
MPPTTGAVAKLESAHGAAWTAIGQARRRAIERREELGSLVREARSVPEDTAFVVFGSLAREELTEGSDVDWALLVDGPTDDGHSSAVHRLRALLRERNYKDPGTGGLFGGLAISHELVHRIGGDSDSNRNITQRILLLLESRAPMRTDVVRTRVLRVLLTRYLVDDFGYAMPPKSAARVPRFLLNDIVRYWRTMAVDFAAKRREREGAGWGLRNFKLRMSRKLIFAAGLVACLSCKLRPPESLALPAAETEEDYAAIMATHLLSFVDSTPLDILAWASTQFEADGRTVAAIFESYDAFLGLLSDTEARNRLDELRPEEALGDSLFKKTRDIGNRFQDGLSALFFDSDRDLKEAAQRYGVF